MDSRGQGEWNARTVTKELIGASGFFLLALVGVVESLRLPLGSWHSPAPGLFPLLLSLVLAAMALALVIVTVARRRAAPSGGSAGARAPGVWWTVVALLAFYALLEPLGFLPSSFLLLVFLLRAIARRGWGLTLGLGAAASLASYAVFDRVLKLPMPAGLLGF